MRVRVSSGRKLYFKEIHPELSSGRSASWVFTYPGKDKVAFVTLCQQLHFVGKLFLWLCFSSACQTCYTDWWNQLRIYLISGPGCNDLSLHISVGCKAAQSQTTHGIKLIIKAAKTTSVRGINTGKNIKKKVERAILEVLPLNVAC